MKLEIFNFKCYKGKHTFTIDDEGITLISGYSGVGKSSLVSAIFFAITGQPTKPTPVTIGEDTCKVILDWLNLKIIRSKRPDCLKIETSDGYIYEDDIAQSHIYQIYGTNFFKISYISQNYIETFIFMSPSKKLEFLESLCFSSDEDIENNPNIIKEKIKNSIKQLEKEINSISSHINLLTEQLKDENIEVPVEIQKPDIEIKDFFSSKLQELKSKEKELEHKSNLYFQLEEYQKNISNSKEILKKLESNNEKYKNLFYSIEELQNNKLYKKLLDNLVFHEDIWVEYSKEDNEEYIKDYERDIAYHKNYLKILKNISELEIFETKIKNLQKEKENLLNIYEGKYNCPNCNIDLLLSDNELVISQEKGEIKLSSKEKKKEMMESIQNKIDNLSSKISSLEFYKEQKRELEEKIDITESLSSLEDDLIKLKNHYQSNLKKEEKNKYNLEKQIEYKQKITLNLEYYEIENLIHFQKNKEKLIQEIQLYENRLETNKKSLGNFVIDEIRNVKDDIKKIEQNLIDIREQEFTYENYVSQKNRWNKFVSKQKLLQEKQILLSEINKKLECNYELKNLVLKTESEVIDWKLREISDLVNTLSETLFIEPLFVELSTTKSTKEGEKIQVNLQLTYKNVNDVSLLSGGEKARLNLIFMIAFNMSFKSPLLLLDECTSNLDQEMTELVLEQIEKLNLPKVLFIAHQIVEGNFSQIIRI